MSAAPPAFPIAPLHLVLRSQGMACPDFPGSLWHGGLGMMLQRHFPAAFALLYGGQDDARLYAIQPSLSAIHPAGDTFPLRLTLFGDATDHILACTQAIALLGEAGLGPAGRYRLERASVLAPQGESVYFTAADGLLVPPSRTGFDAWLPPPTDAGEVAVSLRTPLRLKEGNGLLRRAPDYAQLIHRLFGRLDQLAHAMGVSPPLPKSERAPLIEEALRVATADADVRWDDLTRRSARTRQQMSFGGLVGHLRYAGDLRRTLPWLIAGQHLQIGGKTAFGFGGYTVTAAV